MSILKSLIFLSLLYLQTFSSDDTDYIVLDCDGGEIPIKESCDGLKTIEQQNAEKKTEKTKLGEKKQKNLANYYVVLSDVYEKEEYFSQLRAIKNGIEKDREPYIKDLENENVGETREERDKLLDWIRDYRPKYLKVTVKVMPNLDLQFIPDVDIKEDYEKAQEGHEEEKEEQNVIENGNAPSTDLKNKENGILNTNNETSDTIEQNTSMSTENTDNAHDFTSNESSPRSTFNRKM